MYIFLIENDDNHDELMIAIRSIHAFDYSYVVSMKASIILGMRARSIILRVSRVCSMQHSVFSHASCAPVRGFAAKPASTATSTHDITKTRNIGASSKL